MSLNRVIPWAIVAVGAILFWHMAQIEAPMVAAYWLNPEPAFRDFMANSVYEGRSFGGSDIGVTLAIICFFTWIYTRHSSRKSALLTPKELKFVWLSSLTTALLAVHSLKWIISRARPKVILSPDMPFESLSAMTWPGFMPLDGPRGLDWNSFPSGHTASCAILLSFAYILWPRNRALSLTAYFLVAAYCVLMGVARSMAGMHWLSDSVASFFLAWTVIHVMANRMAIHSKDGQPS